MRRRVSPLHFDGHRLRALRRQRGLRVEDVAAISGITARHIWRLEAGTRPRVAAVTLARIALALNTSVDYLVDRQPERDTPRRRSTTVRVHGERRNAVMSKLNRFTNSEQLSLEDRPVISPVIKHSPNQTTVRRISSTTSFDREARDRRCQSSHQKRCWRKPCPPSASSSGSCPVLWSAIPLGWRR